MPDTLDDHRRARDAKGSHATDLPETSLPPTIAFATGRVRETVRETLANCGVSDACRVQIAGDLSGARAGFGAWALAGVVADHLRSSRA